MKNILPPGLVKQSLSSHSWVGLLVGVLMYLVCLSGTLAVFYNEFERWEQPAVAESATYDPQTVDTAFNAFLNSGTEITSHMYLTLPTGEIPRVTVASDLEGRFVNADGSLGEETFHEWTHMLLHMHLYLHLPESWGMILVSALGALLCGLIVSGFLAHPRIFRDAFAWRRGGSERLEQVDLHNRLSVWGAPFHLMIAVTGAWFGLVLLMLGAYTALTGADQAAIESSVYGEDPALEQNVEHVAVAEALRAMPEIAPEAVPIYMTLHEAGTPAQFMEIYGRHPGRLIWSENYRFDASGNYLGKVGFSDGEAGQQALYSVYRLHFGHFGGMGVKLLYAVLGLALTVVSVTGINIWLAKRRTRDLLNPLWAGFVWGTPLAFTLSAWGQVLPGIPATPLFWVGLLLTLGLAVLRREPAQLTRLLQTLSGLALLLFLAHYSLRFGAAAFGPAALGVNTGLLLCALAFLGLAGRAQLRARQPQSTSLAAAAGG